MIVQDANQISAIEDAARAACASATQATQLATLTTMTGAYRDASVAMEGLYVQRVLKRDPLTAQPVPSQPPLPADSDSVSSIFPVVDVTQLSDADPSVPQGPQQYNQQYMDRITCWQQTQPSHVETSTMLRTGISLFPPQEVTYPTYIDFQAATRLLEKHKSRKRLGLFKKLSKYQDKYQLKTWDHRKGE